MNNKVIVFDTTLRDGEQVPGCQLNTQEKVELALTLEALGVDVIEAGFPISSPGDFQSVVAVSKAVKEPIICALTRAVEKDIDCAAEALKFAKRKRIHTGMGSSDIHIQHKFRSDRENVLERAAHATRYARNLVEEVEFFCEDAGRADPDFLAKMVETVIRAGATIVNIPDTTGYCMPNQYGALIRHLMNTVPNIDQAILSVHCHNDLGLATANTLAGLENGARQMEVTINGIGERAGNTSLEEACIALKSHHNRLGLHTGIQHTKIYQASRQVTRLMRMPVQPNKAIVGRNAFAHSSGIHQDGILKNRENYEIIDPKDVGIPESMILLTARSGKAALGHRLEKLGYKISAVKLKETYEEFLFLADQKKEIEDDDLVGLMGEKSEKARYEISHLEVSCGTQKPATAKVELNFGKQKLVSKGQGNGPIDAVVDAIDTLAGVEVKLEEFLIQAITRGSDDTGKAHIQISLDGTYYYGFGSDTDIVNAAAKAYVDALNKI